MEAAILREKSVKRWLREWKMNLIERDNPHWSDLAIGLGFNTPLRGTGVWLGLAIGLLIVAVLLLVRWRRRVRLGLIAA